MERGAIIDITPQIENAALGAGVTGVLSAVESKQMPDGRIATVIKDENGNAVTMILNEDGSVEIAGKGTERDMLGAMARMTNSRGGSSPEQEYTKLAVESSLAHGGRHMTAAAVYVGDKKFTGGESDLKNVTTEEIAVANSRESWHAVKMAGKRGDVTAVMACAAGGDDMQRAGATGGGEISNDRATGTFAVQARQTPREAPVRQTQIAQ